MNLKNTIFYPFLGLAFVLLAIPICFTGNQIAAGVCSILGFCGFLFLNRAATGKKRIFFTYSAFALSFAVRFCRVFSASVSLFFIGFAVMLLLGIVLDAFLFLTKLISKTLLKPLTPFVFPICYTILFVVLAAVRFGNTFNLINYFSLLIPLSYNLKWATEFGLTFLILLAICLFIEIPFSLLWKRKTFNMVFGALIIVGLAISGASLSIKTRSEEPSYTLKVALATAEKRDFNGLSETPMSEQDYRDMFKEQVIEAYDQKADLMVFQEEYAEFSLSKESEWLSYYSNVLKTYQMPALIGVSAGEEGSLYKNKAYFFDGTGTLISSYQKVNLIPYIETKDYELGSGGPAYFTTTLGGHDINVSTAICFDINNDLFMRKLNPSTELLLVPSWDWDNGNEEQLRTYVRSIEYDLTMVKHSYDGFSYVSTPTGLYGNIVDNRDKGRTVTVVDVPIFEK